jgi:hypothetical protein
VLRTVTLLPEAVTDVANGYRWYEDQEPGLGEEFLRCVERAYALIAAHPLHYPVRFDSFRRILVRRFPSFPILLCVTALKMQMHPAPGGSIYP